LFVTQVTQNFKSSLDYLEALLTSFIATAIAINVPNTTNTTGRLSPIIPIVSALIPVTAVETAVKILASKNVGTYGVGFLESYTY